MDFEFLIPISIFIVFAFVVKTISDNNVRRLLVEKGSVNEDLKYLFMNMGDLSLPASLKWGIVLVAVGLAVIVGQFLPGDEEVVTAATMFIFAGVGLLLYYGIAKNMIENVEK